MRTFLPFAAVAKDRLVLAQRTLCWAEIRHSPRARDSPTEPSGPDIGGTPKSGVVLRRRKAAPSPE